MRTCLSSEIDLKGLAETNSSLQTENLSLSAQLAEARAEAVCQADRAKDCDARLEDLQAKLGRLQEEREVLEGTSEYLRAEEPPGEARGGCSGDLLFEGEKAEVQRQALLEVLQQNEVLQQEVTKLREGLLELVQSQRADVKASPSSLGYTCESLPETVGSSLASPEQRAVSGGSSRLECSWLVSGPLSSNSAVLGLGACPEGDERQQEDLSASIATIASDLDELRGVLQDVVS